ncbi:MAG: 4Fe-4S dicluster domain-containing protein [Chitinivibrionales bacterium]|nr:4Fe-4S dicluster domain-containing protein [Chitinivibrionales bacterium]
MSVTIDSRKCTGCGVCIPSCPRDALSYEERKAVVDPTVCRECGFCVSRCPQEAMIIHGKSVGNS